MSDSEHAPTPADEQARPGDEAAAAVITPVARGQRIETLDFIRGIAVMGILVANIVGFGQPYAAYMYPSAFLVPDGDPDGWMWIAQFVLVDGKLRGLFTLLFGAGLYLFMERTWARGGTRALQVRRLMFLLMFGLLHFFLIWRGDILALYAMCGLVVLLFIKLPAANQLILGAIGYFFGALAYAGLFAPLPFIADGEPSEQAAMASFQTELANEQAAGMAGDSLVDSLKQSGDYYGWVAERFETQWTEPFISFLMFSFESIPLMLIGMGLYRMGFFSGGMERARLIRWGWIGLVGGTALHLAIALWVQANGFTYYGTMGAFMGLRPLPGLIMVLAMAALMVAYTPAWTGWLAQRVRAAGRAAFTNYLGTSIVMLFVFHGWALGLFGMLNRPMLYLVAGLTCVLMLIWSKPWLDRFRYGPLEWLWRCLTYGKMFPLRR